MKEIPLTKGAVAIVDEEDYERLIAQGNWHLFSGGYAARSVKKPRRKTVLMHKEILPGPSDLEVDHINGDGLDNRRANLRLVSHSANLHNHQSAVRSNTGQRNIHLHKAGGLRRPYQVYSTENMSRTTVGYYRTLDLAIVARDMHEWCLGRA
jgi:hypothetical protein